MYNPELEPYKRALHHIIFWEDYIPMGVICPQVVDIIKEYCKGKDRKGRRLVSGYAVADHIKQKGSVEYWKSNPMFRSVKVKWSEERRGIKGSELANNTLKDISPQPSLVSLESLQSLESLERLQSLESISDMTERANLSPQDMFIETSNISYSDYAYRDGDVVYCDPPYKNTHDYGILFDSYAFWEWVRTRNFPVYVSEYQAPEDFVSIWNKEKRVLLDRESLTEPRTEHLFVHKRFADATP